MGQPAPPTAASAALRSSPSAAPQSSAPAARPAPAPTARQSPASAVRQAVRQPAQPTHKPGRRPVAVLGATGAVGQRFIERLHHHPQFQLVCLVASDARAGQTYGEAANWLLDSPLPPAVAAMPLSRLEDLHDRAGSIAAVFSALPSGTAGPVESDLARRGFKVFTNAKDHRMDPDVPLLIPEINPDHLDLVRHQAGPGWIVANGNCTAIVLLMALAPLERGIGIESLHVTSLQGLSGAGYPGVPSLDVVDNVVPYIGGEEEKVESEPQKTLGRLVGGRVEPLPLAIQATCTRVPVREGHTESVHLRLRRPTTLAEIRGLLESFRGPPDVQALPTAPRQPIHLVDGADRPQPRRDRDREGGMAVSVGRLRLSPDGRDLRLVVLGHNTVRGAAGQSVLNAEYAHARGLL